MLEALEILEIRGSLVLAVPLAAKFPMDNVTEWERSLLCKNPRSPIPKAL